MNNLVHVLKLWKESRSTFPNDLRLYSGAEQQEKEQKFEEFIACMKSKVRNSRGSVDMLRAEKTELIGLLTEFFSHTLDYTDEQLQVILSDEMVKSTWSFLKAARKYDPELSLEDASQALRNVWIMNGLQLLMGREVCLTASVFAYSMLYPYTDNFLDDSSIPDLGKLAFGERFASRLAGSEVKPLNGQEAKIYEMVSLIEKEWPRELYGDLYQSLQSIHAAQSDSVRLLAGMGELNFDERMAICIHKGGTSVVADGFLIAGSLAPQEQEFLYGYGACLQLLDDWQDLKDDRNAGVLTAFSSAGKSGCMDSLINRTFHLGQQVIQLAGNIDSAYIGVFQGLMKRSIDLFLVEAVQANSGLFSPAFVLAFNEFSPMSFSYIERKNGSFSPYQNQLLERIIQQALSSGEEEEFPFLNNLSQLKQEV